MHGIIRVSAIAMAFLFIATASAIILADGSDAYSGTYTLDYEVGQEVDENLTDITGKGLLIYVSGDIPSGLEIEFVKVSSNWLYSTYNTHLKGTPTP